MTTIRFGRWGFCWLLLATALPAWALAPLPFALRDELHGNYANWRHGEAVAMDGDTLIVGVPFASQSHDGTAYTRNGAVGVHRWQGGRWVAVRWLYLSSFGYGLQNEARFGSAVAVSGNRLLIGCPGCTAPRPKAILMDVPDSPFDGDLVWQPLQPALTSPNDAALGIGSAVALSGSILAIGAPRATFGQPEFGAVALGRIDGAQVVWEDALYGWEGSRYGQALAITSTVNPLLPLSRTYSVVVGAPAYVESGAFGIAGRAELLRRNSNGSWVRAQEFANPAPGIADGLGSGVAIHRPRTDGAGYIALGAPGRALDGGPAGGSVRLYRHDDGNYVFDQEIRLSAPAVFDRYGGAVALHGERLLVGADGRAVDLLANAGSAYVYERRFVPALLTFRWVLQQSLLPRGGGDGAFGSAVAITARAAAVGAPRHDGTAVEIGTVATYLCDRIFAHDLDSDAGEACAGP